MVRPDSRVGLPTLNGVLLESKAPFNEIRQKLKGFGVKNNWDLDLIEAGDPIHDDPKLNSPSFNFPLIKALPTSESQEKTLVMKNLFREKIITEVLGIPKGSFESVLTAKPWDEFVSFIIQNPTQDNLIVMLTGYVGTKETLTAWKIEQASDYELATSEQTS